jgi:hypothetical protein
VGNAPKNGLVARTTPPLLLLLLVMHDIAGTQNTNQLCAKEAERDVIRPCPYEFEQQQKSFQRTATYSSMRHNMLNLQDL